MGRLIPAGTGMPRYRYLGIQVEGGDEEPLEEFVEPTAAEPAVSAEPATGLMASGKGEGPSDPGLEA